MPGENRVIEALTRPNSLFLSAAAQNNHEQLTPVYRWLFTAIEHVAPNRPYLIQRTAQLCQSKKFRKTLSEIMAKADLGISEINVTENALELLKPMPASTLEFSHQAGNTTVTFSLAQESDGTLALLALLGPIVEALLAGGVVVIDEIDAHLHPLLALHLVEHFNTPAHNPNGAQLIFTSHDMSLFRALRRDQIWFTEKKLDGSSHLYPLSDFKLRQDVNISSGYLQGRFGAIPFLNGGLTEVLAVADVEK